MARKGIILAGGNGTRLFPLTHSISKQVLPVYDKPLLLYPIQTVLDAGVDEIIFIIKPDQYYNFQGLISKLKLPVKYNLIMQMEPDGLAQAFILAEEYIEGHSVVLALGDNIFYSDTLNEDLANILQACGQLKQLSVPNLSLLPLFDGSWPRPLGGPRRHQ